MNDFTRALGLAFRYPWNVAACWGTSLLVAVLWAANFAAVWPVVDAVMQGKSVPQWLTTEVANEQARLTKIADERADLTRRLGAALPEEEQKLRDKLADCDRRAGYSQTKIDSTRWALGVSERWLPATPFATLGAVCVFLLVGTTIKSVFRVLNLVLVSRLGNLVSHDLRRQFYAKILRLDLVDFSDRGRGDLMTRCTTDLQQVGGGVQLLFGQAIREPLKMVVCAAGAAWFSWRLLLITIAITPLAILGIRWLGKSLKRANHRAMEELSSIYETLTDTLSGIRLIRTHTQESAERGRFHRSLKQLYGRQMRIAVYDSLASPLTEQMGVMMVVLAAMAGGYLVLNEQTHLFGVRISATPLTHGQMTAFFAMLAGMGDPARRLSGVFNVLQSASASADRVYQVLDREPAIADPPIAKPFNTAWRSLRFDNVSFQYTPDRIAVDEVDLEIRRGETLAIVGPNGCGKSTLVSLVPRLYDASEGSVLWGDIDVRDLGLKDLRTRIGVVSQQAQLVNDTVAENIRYGRPGATQEQVEAAARAAHAHAFITERLSDGYATVVGPGGGKLSGGQRQRVALARAILRDPELLILDEATSQVDVESEALIHRALAQFVKGRTAIVITHRPSTLALADRVAVMEHGRLIDLGTPDELEGRCDLFRRLCCVGLRETA
jgi:ATP-binding cassette subfamily B protein/subfamily B ATP-binding cassette protein MsbA